MHAEQAFDRRPDLAFGRQRIRLEGVLLEQLVGARGLLGEQRLD